MAVGSYVPAIAAKVFEAHGFPSASILSDWPEIIGAEFAAITAPEKLVWPRGDAHSLEQDENTRRASSHRRTGATLVLRVDGPRALEIQHIAPQLLERINIYFGYRAVADLRIIQGPVGHHRPQPPPAKKLQKVALDTEIEDGKLRAALEKLGGRLD